MVKRILGGVFFAVCVTAVLFVVLGGHLDTVVGEPLGLWGRWLSGEKVDNDRLWGRPMLWWARTGKLLQFAAGLTVVLDILGPGRLREFGARLRRQSWHQLAERLRGAAMAAAAILLLAYYLAWGALVVLDPPRDVARRVLAVLLGPIGAVAAVLTLLLLGIVFYTLRQRDRDEPKVDDEVLALARRVNFFLVGGLPLLLWTVLTRGVLLPITNGLVRLFDRDEPGHPVRWPAFFLFLIGFGFDLFAS